MTIDDDESTRFAESLVDLPSRAPVPFAFGDSQLIEKLYGLLTVHKVNPETAQEIKRSLIQILKSNFKYPMLSDIHKMSTKCVACPDMNHDASLPKWNRESPDVLFIMESPDCLSPDGKELFISSLVKTGFSNSECALTYVTRCTKSASPTLEEVSTCTSLYLYTEIQLMNPKVIVPLGAVASQALLGPAMKLSDITAQPQVIWLGPWAIIPNLSANYAAHPRVNRQKEFQLILEKARSLVPKQEENAT